MQLKYLYFIFLYLFSVRYVLHLFSCFDVLLGSVCIYLSFQIYIFLTKLSYCEEKSLVAFISKTTSDKGERIEDS